MYDGLKLSGQKMTPVEVMGAVRKDRAYYDNSGGGLTLSGGEPLLHPDFCAELFRLARAEGISTAIDTAADVPWEAFAEVLPYTRMVLLDVKIMDRTVHETYTGKPNDRILANGERLFGAPVDLYVRIPVIAGVNDDPENAEETARFLRDARNLRRVTLLPYHSLGVDKARSIGVKQELFAPPDEERLDMLKAFFPESPDGIACRGSLF
jgi:pyruvate formate lyase activating enzyme